MITRSDSKEEWLTLNDAAERFRVSRRTLERLRKQGVLPGVRMGRYLSVRTVDVQQALAQRSPLQTYRQQAAAPNDLSSRDWLIGWRRLFEGNSRTSLARKWIDRLIDEHGDSDLNQLSVGDVVRAGQNLKLTGDMSLIFEALSGVAPERNMLETTRTMLKMLVPAI
ncbi:MAG: helix-turn-helix domain-containing protein [bacterium]|nr:helix-turn-helix domain-containing protein [bacterium]